MAGGPVANHPSTAHAMTAWLCMREKARRPVARSPLFCNSCVVQAITEHIAATGNDQHG